jgi:cyclase
VRARHLSAASILCSLIALMCVPVIAQNAPVSPQSRTEDLQIKLEVLHVQGRVYMIAGAGANIAVEVGDHSVILVDAGAQGTSDKVLAAIRTLTAKPIQYIIETSTDEDMIGGSTDLASAGYNYTGQRAEPPGAGVLAQLRALTRLSASAPPGAKVPTDAYDEQWSFFNDEAIVLKHATAAHSDGDSYVVFRRSDVIATGALLDTDHYPVIDARQGGSLDGIISALNDIIADLMVPRENEEGGTYLIPGHGRICDRTEVVNYRDALTIIRARVRARVAKRMTLEPVLASRPTDDYDGIYGSDTGPWTTRMFIEEVYREAVASPKHSP